MTHIEFRKEVPCYYLSAMGHATNEPEACAGISAILYALAGWLANSPVFHHATMERGNVRIGFASGMGTDGIVQMTLIGLQQIARKYPNAVELRIVDNIRTLIRAECPAQCGEAEECGAKEECGATPVSRQGED